MAQEGQKRLRGGQTKPPLERKRNNLTFRARDQLKQDLEAIAAKNGRSLSEEIEFRLELSLDCDKALGGSEMACVVRSFGPHVLALEAKTGRRWFDDDALAKTREMFEQTLIWYGELFSEPTPPEKRRED